MNFDTHGNFITHLGVLVEETDVFAGRTRRGGWIRWPLWCDATRGILAACMCCGRNVVSPIQRVFVVVVMMAADSVTRDDLKALTLVATSNKKRTGMNTKTNGRGSVFHPIGPFIAEPVQQSPRIVMLFA